MLEKINTHKILEFLSFNYSIVVLKSIPSTNDYLFSQIRSGESKTDIVLSEMQTAGKGCNGKKWNSPLGNIYFSMYKLFKCKYKELYGLSWAVGIVVAKVLRSYGLHDITLKWPNDVYWHGRKIGGILIETIKNGINIDVVIGIGINIKDNTSPKFVCLEEALKQDICRTKLIAKIIKELHILYNIFFNHNCKLYMKQEWLNFSKNIKNSYNL